VLGVKEDSCRPSCSAFRVVIKKFDSITIGRQFEMRGWKCGAVGMENMEGHWQDCTGKIEATGKQ
jgi:hypothetical protein